MSAMWIRVTALLLVICLYGLVIVPVILPRIMGAGRSFPARAWGQLGYGVAIPTGFIVGWLIQMLFLHSRDIPVSQVAGILFLGLGVLCLLVGIVITRRVRVESTSLLLALFRPPAGVTWKEAMTGRKGWTLFILEAALMLLTLGVANVSLSLL